MNERRLNRLSRRRALVGVSAAGAAALLAACGGNKSEQSPSGGSSGAPSGAIATPTDQGNKLLTKPVDASGQATPGGVYAAFVAEDIEGMDPHKAGSTQVQTVARFTSLRLLKWKTNLNGEPATAITGDAAESFELATDGLSIAFRLRQGLTWDKRAPTNGRAVDAEDVKFSATRFLATSPNAVNFFNSKSKAAPIMAVETPDARTVVFKLAFPYMPLLATLCRNLNMWLVPREADGGYDAKVENRGCGPWILESYKPSVGMEFKRNPDYYEKGRPFLDGWSAPVVPEYATRLAQFRAGNLWSGVVKQEDVLATKRDLPQLSMFQGQFGTDTPSLFFGFQGPFKDARLRQAVSYLIDRQLIAETISDAATFEKAGLPKNLRINTAVGAGFAEWLDPFGKDFGPNAKFFKQNIAEAKKLLAAAGVNDKLQTKFYYPQNGYSAVYQQAVQILAQMINDTGVIDAKLTPLDYQKEYVPKIHFGGERIGAWDGLALTPAAQGDDAGHQLQVQYHSGGAATRQPQGEDAKLDQMIDAQLREIDPAKRAKLVQDIQRYMPETMIAVPVFYQNTGFELAWPWAGNVSAARSSVTGGVLPSEVYPYLWYDKAAHTKHKP